MSVTAFFLGAADVLYGYACDDSTDREKGIFS